jgi:hypothetical protein
MQRNAPCNAAYLEQPVWHTSVPFLRLRLQSYRRLYLFSGVFSSRKLLEKL